MSTWTQHVGAAIKSLNFCTKKKYYNKDKARQEKKKKQLKHVQKTKKKKVSFMLNWY